MTKLRSTPTPKALASRRFVMTPLAAAVVNAMFAQGALAQEERVTLEEVIVTATKRTLNLQDVGQSIMAFSTADIENMGIKSMSDYILAPFSDLGGKLLVV